MNKLTLFLALAMIVSVYSYGTGASCYIDANLRKLFLEAHNNLRQKVASGGEPLAARGYDIEAMSYDPTLEQWAQNWAATCPSGHRDQKLSGTSMGENIYWSWSSYFPKAPVTDFVSHATKSVQAWYDEVSLFSNSKVNPFVFDYATGHYTQVVWAKSNKVGCGVTLCNDASPSSASYPNVITVVCNYGPPGNYIGSQLYSTTPATCAKPNARYPNLCGDINDAGISSNTYNTCPGEPGKSPAPTPAVTPATTTPATTTPAATTPATTTPATTTPATTTPATTTPATQVIPAGNSFIAPASFSKTHTAYVLAAGKAPTLMQQITGKTWTIAEFQGVLSFNSGQILQFPFKMQSGASSVTFIVKTSGSGSTWNWYCWQYSSPPYTAAQLQAKVAANQQ